jgi:hypothetical protein
MLDGWTIPSTIRPMCEPDFDEWIAVAREKYAEQYPRMHREGTRAFLEHASRSPDFLLLVGRNVCFCAAAVKTYMEPEYTVGGVWIFTKRPDVREFLGVIRRSEAWAVELDAVEVGFGNVSDKSFSKAAAWLGYTKRVEYFVKKLR